MSLSDDIKSLAYRAGFHSVGITGAEPFVESEEAIRDRLGRGLLEGSGYAEGTAHRYTHPRETLPTARSIIAVALSYLTDDMDQSTPGVGPKGWMARFSRGLDYHKVLQDRLLVLAGNLQTMLGRRVEVRSFADTGPIADRSVAVRAGIGSRGKNTCVYAGEYRSWVVLGELLTDLELDPDPPTPLDICGECTACMDACPTGAICAPYTVDVRICLSQVTQSKGMIPHPLRKKMGTRIYGCDTCQSACPLNHGAKPGNIEELRPSMGVGKDPELIPLLQMTSAEFRARIHPTTAGWIRRTRFRRNAAIALGNIGDPVAVPALAEALSDPELIVRAHAAWSLGRIGTRDARSALERALPGESEGLVTAEIRAALGAE